ncbi:NAD(P)-dependent oxidoreductase [Bordetella sp. 02P26C-1]|uniref:NAD(P)-dependent oxidoreductase n=1 Tax=Bordetella sp. 02P26C-1 TaxID=2683195 RepID=UPI001353FB1A|nr:hydroxyacid dehydrogenase [Bordetella sp. 02P26C-1]MVW80410.1 hydroxyacid dehydrogenase [Bordetella sp. 02P26C-1]
MTAKPRVLLTNPIHPDIAPELNAHAEVIVAPDVGADTLRKLIADVDAIIVRAMLPPDIFDHAPKLRAVVRHGVGLDMIPMDAANARRIPVANVPGSNTSAVVEYCVAAMFALLRPLPRIDASLRQAGWGQSRPLADGAAELSGKVCGIVGVGAIGSRLARAASGLGMSVMGLTRRPETLPADVQAATKQALFAQSDVVVLCCPLTDETRGLASEALINSMKPGALLVNVSRGPVVDTQALLSALRRGHLGGAALDVHDVQPLPPDSPVFDAPNLLLTPHIAGITDASMRRMSEGAVANLLALLRGDVAPNIVNPQVLSPSPVMNHS